MYEVCIADGGMGNIIEVIEVDDIRILDNVYFLYDDKNVLLLTAPQDSVLYIKLA